MSLTWGILSVGDISHDFVTAMGTHTEGDHRIAAAAAHNLDRAKEFAEFHDIPKYYGSYEELAKDADVEVVYIGNLNNQHFDSAMLMLEHGKHVLCEKPLCMNEEEAKKLIKFAEEKKLFLMEAVWSRFFPAYYYLRQQIDNGALGELQEIHVSFGQDMGGKDRIHQKSMGGGSILDLGGYPIQLSQFVFRLPLKSVQATGTLNSDGVDTDMKATLNFADNKFAKIETSVTEDFANKAVIKGTKGQITLDPFWCPTKFIDVDGAVKEFPLPAAKHKFNFVNSCGLRYEMEEVRKCIRTGLIESSIMSHNDTLFIANAEHEIRRQLGVVYPEDKKQCCL